MHNNGVVAALIASSTSECERKIILDAWNLAEEIREIRQSQWSVSKAKIDALDVNAHVEIEHAMNRSVQEQQTLDIQFNHRKEALARKWQRTLGATQTNNQSNIPEEQPLPSQDASPPAPAQPINAHDETLELSSTECDISDDSESEEDEVTAEVPESPRSANQSEKRGAENHPEISMKKTQTESTEIQHLSVALQAPSLPSSERERSSLEDQLQNPQQSFISQKSAITCDPRQTGPQRHTSEATFSIGITRAASRHSCQDNQ